MTARREAVVELAAAVFAGGEQAGTVAFSRTCTRAARLKRRCDCGHTVDGSRDRDQLYRYHVAKVIGEPGLVQRTDCDPCSRADARY